MRLASLSQMLYNDIIIHGNKKSDSVCFTDNTNCRRIFKYMNAPRLETASLILRKFTEDDMDALYALLKDEEVNVFLPWFPVKTLKETIDFYF